MRVVYASNDGYARHLGVSLYSLLDHNKDVKELEVYLLSVGMGEENQERLRQIVKKFQRELHVVEMGNLKDRFTIPVDTRGFDISAMTRLFVGEALPEDVGRVLYLDCDTVVLKNLSGLWETDLGGRILGMVQEPTAYPEMKQAIDLGKDDAYYNSGVLLIDLTAWRRKEIQRRLLEYYAAKGGNLFACDQDALNGALRGLIADLAPKYNFFTNYRYFRYDTLAGMCRSYEAVGSDALEEAKRRPAIIHYMGDERPWIAGNHNHYRKYYEVYLSRTPWAGMPPETGKEAYMLAYWGMNQMTRICPPLRLAISRGFGMKVRDARRDKRESALPETSGKEGS